MWYSCIIVIEMHDTGHQIYDITSDYVYHLVLIICHTTNQKAQI